MRALLMRYIVDSVKSLLSVATSPNNCYITALSVDGGEWEYHKNKGVNPIATGLKGSLRKGIIFKISLVSFF